MAARSTSGKAKCLPSATSRLLGLVLVIALGACVADSASVGGPVSQSGAAQAEVLTSDGVIECRELGGGFRYERRHDVVGLGLVDRGLGAEEMREREQELRANGWTESLYETLSHLGQDYELARMAGFEGSEAQLKARQEAASRLLAQMQRC